MRNRTRRFNLALMLMAALFFALYAVMSTMSYNDEASLEKQYKSNVCDGIWPDYKGIEPDC